MASRKDRFGALGGPSSGPGKAQTADLFEHYGIAVDPATPTEATAAVEAGPCRRCGWLLALRRDETPCPVCSEAQPHLAPEPAPSKR